MLFKPTWYVKDQYTEGIFGMFGSEEKAVEMRKTLNKQYQTDRYVVKKADD